jgi:alkylation response protein AidB-like acyl-CoA dehydrogenase
MAVPSVLGGAQAPLVVQYEVLEILAGLDPAAAWYAFNARPPAVALARLDPTAGQKVMGNPDAYFAFSLVVGSNLALRVDGGYLLSGRWPVVSGSPAAGWLLLSAAASDVADGQAPSIGSPDVRHCFVPADAVTVEDTWHANALRATASNAVSIEDWFVADEFVTSLRAPTNDERPLYRVPTGIALQCGVGAVMLGVARAALNALALLAATRFSASRGVVLREIPWIGETIGAAEAKLRAARLFFYESARAVVAAAEQGDVADHVRAEMWAAYFHVEEVAVEVADAAYKAGGIDALLESCPLGGFARDMRGLSQTGQTWGQAKIDVGRVYLGAGPTDPRF